MDISRFLMLRLAALSLAIFATALALALWLAQVNIQHEGEGASQVALMLDHLGALESGPAQAIPVHLAALRDIAHAGQLRHLRLGLQDAGGRDLLAETGAAAVHPPPESAKRRTTWMLQRDDGLRYQVTLTVDPGSERRESTTGILGMLAILLGYGAVTLFAVYLALRSALRPLKDILHAIAQYERSRYEYRLEPIRIRELNAIGQALNRMAEALAHEQSLRHALDLRMRRLQEEERERLARELHDEFGQNLTAMRADAAWLLRRTLGQQDLQDVATSLAERCEHMQHGTRELLHRLRLSGHRGDGTPPSLLGLLQELVDQWQRQPDQRTRYDLQVELDEELSGEVALAVYRLTQEALTNVARHADARQVGIRLRRIADGRLEWSVHDDGVGIAATESALLRGNGLAGMRERVRSLRGELEIAAAQPDAERQGLLLVARWPLEAAVIGPPLEPEAEAD